MRAASSPQTPQTPNLCPLLAFFFSFFRCHRDQRQPNTDIKWLPGSLAFLRCLLSPVPELPSAARPAPSCPGEAPGAAAAGSPWPLSELGNASGRALSACPQPGHPRVLSCPRQSISQRGRAEPGASLSPGSRVGTLPRHPRPQLCPAAGKVAVTKARRGRGDPAIALGTFVPYSLPESVDFVPSLGVALGRVWRRWHGPKSARDLAPDSR